jgi:RNA polymerase sigma-70 factor, ECF subfamily
LSNTGEGAGLGSLSDEALVVIATEDPQAPRSRDAASELLGRYRRRVYLWCYRYVRDHERAMDLAQDTLLNAYRGLATYQSGSRFVSWIGAIAKNRCFNELRRPNLMVDEEPDFDSIPSGGEDPAEELSRRLDEEALLHLLHETLDEEEQEVVWLRCFERMPIEMIGEVLQIRQASGARGLLQRARRKLRRAFEARQAAEEEV